MAGAPGGYWVWHQDGANRLDVYRKSVVGPSIYSANDIFVGIGIVD